MTYVKNTVNGQYQSQKVQIMEENLMLDLDIPQRLNKTKLSSFCDCQIEFIATGTRSFIDMNKIFYERVQINSKIHFMINLLAFNIQQVNELIPIKLGLYPRRSQLIYIIKNQFIIHVFTIINDQINNQYNQIYHMKKYVSKQDVQQGLVDPTKPLTDQKEYMEKIEHEGQKKVAYKEKKNGFQRRQREDRPKYNWNKRDVTLETAVPEKPKKVIPKPDKDKYHEKKNALRKQLDNLYEQKNNLHNEMKFALKNMSENKKMGQAAYSKFSNAVKQKTNTKNIIQDEMNLLKEKRDKFDAELTAISNKLNSLKKPQNFDDCSTEQLKRRLEKTEMRLTTQDLNKNQQNKINQKILEIKRAIARSRPEAEVEAQMGRLQNQNNLIYSELKKVKADLKSKFEELVAIRGQIDTIYNEKNKEEDVKDQPKNSEEIKAQYEQKIEKIKEKRQKVKKELEKHKDSYFKSLDQYEDYYDLVKYIQMVNQQKQKIKKWKQEQELIKKKKEEEKKKRQKEFEEREKKREERKKREEERKKEEEQRRERLKQQRQDYINRNPHQDKIQTCEYLIRYCEMLKPENAHMEAPKREEKVAQPIQELPADNKEWAQQQKKGAEVIVSKKQKKDEEVKKPKKEKKKKQKEQQDKVTSFTHHIDISRQFETINLLPPFVVTQIDDIIKQIQDKISFFSKPTEEEIEAYKKKAEKEFDAKYGLGSEKGRKGYKAKDKEDNEQAQQEEQVEEKKEKKRPAKYEKKQIISTEQFPGLE